MFFRWRIDSTFLDRVCPIALDDLIAQCPSAGGLPIATLPASDVQTKILDCSVPDACGQDLEPVITLTVCSYSKLGQK